MKKNEGLLYTILCSYPILLYFFLYVLPDSKYDFLNDIRLLLSFIFPLIISVAVYFIYIHFAAKKKMVVLRKQIELITKVPLTVKNLKRIETNPNRKCNL